MEYTKQEDIKEYVISMANKISKTYLSINLTVISFAVIILILVNTVLKDGTEDMGDTNKILGILLGAALVITILVPFILKAKAKVALAKLPSDINEKFRTGVRFKDMQRFILADEGLITFIDSRPIYIRYIDMQKAYVFKLSQRILLIPIFTQYFINIETLEKKHSIPIKTKMDKIKYTEQDFIDLTYALHSKNENITLDGISKRNNRVNV